MPMKRLVAKAEHTDVHRHLATEELLLETLPDATTVLYLWAAEKTIVIGKNQNPWLECNLPAMAESGCTLARRISGGGSVFQDAGNLNYAFVTPKDHYDKTALSTVILDAVASLGVPCEIGPRHLLQADGRKFSGNAFCIRRGKVLHHGTLLVNANLRALNQLLTPTCSGIEAKGIRSVPSEVVNLSELNPDLTIDRLKQAIYASFGPTEPPSPVEFAELDERTDRFASEEWLYHRTPRFKANGQLNDLPERPTFRATVNRGIVCEIAVDGHSVLQPMFVGQDFRDLVERARDVSLD